MILKSSQRNSLKGFYKKHLTTEELLGEPYFGFILSYDPAILPAYPVDLYREGKINPSDMIIGANTVDVPDIFAYALGDEAYCEDWIKAYSTFEVMRNQSHSVANFNDSVLDNIEAVYTPDKYGLYYFCN